jgi:hypothetical protein
VHGSFQGELHPEHLFTKITGIQNMFKFFGADMDSKVNTFISNDEKISKKLYFLDHDERYLDRNGQFKYRATYIMVHTLAQGIWRGDKSKKNVFEMEENIFRKNNWKFKGFRGYFNWIKQFNCEYSTK